MEKEKETIITEIRTLLKKLNFNILTGIKTPRDITEIFINDRLIVDVIIRER